MVEGNGLPSGWETGNGRPVIASKHLYDFVYAEVTYDTSDHKYHLWKVNHDGPAQRDPRGSYEALSQVFRRANEL